LRESLTEVAIGSVTLAHLLSFIAEIPEQYADDSTLLLHRTTLFDFASVLASNVQAQQYLLGIIPPMIPTPWIPKGQILGGDFSYYVIYHLHLMQILTGTTVSKKLLELVITEAWTGKATVTDAFRLGTGVTYL